MEYEFILDTNAYRLLARDKYIAEISPLSTELRISQQKKHGVSSMSTVVSMELLNHFKEGDKDFLECFKALCLQYHHCLRFDDPKLLRNKVNSCYN